MSKKVFVFLFVFVLCLSLVVSSYELGDSYKLQVNSSTSTDTKFEVNSTIAVEAHEKLLSYFKERDAAKINSSQEFVYTVEGIPISGYPKYYAGDYINKDGKLVVLLTDDYSGSLFWSNRKTSEIKSEIQEITGVNDIIYDYVEYSIFELANLKKAIYDYITSGSENKFNITGSELDVLNNCVNVYMYPLNIEAENWFKDNIIDHPGIIFFERNPDAIQATVGIVPGSKINASGSNFSVGFKASKSGTAGFITCGHSLVDKANGVAITNSNGSIIGNSYQNERQFGGNLDAAFIRTLSGNTVSSTVYDSNLTAYTMASGYTTPVRGKLVHMVGFKSNNEYVPDDEDDDMIHYYPDGYIASGTVEIVSTDIMYGSPATYIEDLTRCTYRSFGGDSGGLVFTSDGSYYRPVGVQVASEAILVGPDEYMFYSYFCRADLIASGLGVSIG